MYAIVSSPYLYLQLTVRMARYVGWYSENTAENTAGAACREPAATGLQTYIRKIVKFTPKTE
jgi:hypothetical protein